MKFPDLPPLSGQWTPVYMEPVIGSGERITVFIKVSTEEDLLIKRVISTEKLIAMYGKEAWKLNNIIKMIEDDLLNSRPFSLGGFFFGETREARGHNIEGIARQGLQTTASLLEE